MKPIDFTFTCEVELDLMIELEVEFENKVKCEDFLNLYVIPFNICFVYKWLMIDRCVYAPC